VLVVARALPDRPAAGGGRRHNQNARWLLERDVTNLARYVQRYGVGVGVSAAAVAAQLWRRWQRGEG
jgi:serine/threonine-protein kinase RIO1